VYDEGDGSGAVAVFPFFQLSLCQHPLYLCFCPCRQFLRFLSRSKDSFHSLFLYSPHTVFFLDIFAIVRFEILVYLFMYGEGRQCKWPKEGREKERGGGSSVVLFSTKIVYFCWIL
jgi:hypothetical protein